MELPIRPLHCATAHFFHMVNYLYLYMSGVCKWRNLPGTARNQPEPPGTYPEP